MGGLLESAPEALMLPFWPDNERGSPNAMARSALFSVSNKNAPRVWFNRSPIRSIGTAKVVYTGQELRQDDLDVLLNLLHLQRMSPVGKPIAFQYTAFIKVMKWTVNSVSRERLKNIILRLKATALTVEDEVSGSGFSGSLIHFVEWDGDEATAHPLWRVTFHEKIINLFNWASYTRVDFDTRLKLSPLAKWLHLYYTSHDNPFSVKVETLKESCGSSMSNLHHFRSELRDALDSLVHENVIQSYKICKKSDIVHVKKHQKNISVQ